MQSFRDLNLHPALAQAISELGYETPSPIQAATLPILLAETPTDFLGLAATGTGKTAAFGIPLLQRLQASRRKPQAIVLCPTRELAMQVAGQLSLLGKHLRVTALPVYGGASYVDQMHGLKHGAQIIVGTPGRVIDHIERGTLRLEEVRAVVLDEADEMISMGFKDELELILQRIPAEQRTIWLFSATMSPEVRRMANDYLRAPQEVKINTQEMLSENVQQYYYVTQESNKPEVLCKLIDAADDFYGLVFCQTKSLTMDLTKYLVQRKYQVDCLHGDMDQTARDRTMKGFRDKKSRILVCTDVAARGLDVKDVSHVVNYSLPRELENYVHRIGRTARSGKSGIAMSLVTNSHRGLVGAIERLTKSKMEEGKIPTRKELAGKKLAQVLATFKEQKNFTRALELMGDDWKAALAEMPPAEIGARMLSLLFPEVFAEEKMGGFAQKHEHRTTRPFSGGRPRGPRRSDGDGARFERRPRFDRRERSGESGSFQPGDSGKPRFDRKPRFEKKKFVDRPAGAPGADGGPRWKPGKGKFGARPLRPRSEKIRGAVGGANRPGPTRAE
ncbi:MAG: DEAD/DEAH box helicase [Bacteriovoracia bacterium]